MSAYRASAVLLLLALAFTVANGMRSSHMTPGKTVTPPSKATIAPPTPTRIAMAATVPREEKLVVSFRLDPSLTRGLYLGDRWVSPPKYHFAQAGTRFIVQSKVQRIDTRGERSDVSGNWRTSDHGMIDVIPTQRGEVTIVINGPGESTVTASTAVGSKVLNIRAWQVADAMQVEITQ